MQVSGYNNTMRTLLGQVLGALSKLAIKQDRFDIAKDQAGGLVAYWNLSVAERNHSMRSAACVLQP